jgi:hypothetical protein
MLGAAPTSVRAEGTMPKLGTVSLKGASGRTYEFEVFPRADAFKPLGAVYFLAKRIPISEREAEYTWIYIGETWDMSMRPLDERRKACIDQHEANSLCLHIEDDPGKRARIVADLHRARMPVCNDPLPPGT